MSPDQDVIAVGLATACISILETVIPVLSDTIVELLGPTMSQYLEKHLSDFDPEKYYETFSKAYEMAMERAEMNLLMERVKHDDAT